MNANFEDLTGKKFAKWTVIERADNNNSGSARWLCICDCGSIKIKSGQDLKKAKQGCRKCYVSPNKIHGGKGTRLYEIWRQMLYRCEKPNHKAFKDYGGRGISVCTEWHELLSFKKWADENGYDCKKTIDRIDVDGNYTPDNCRWTDSKTQMNNRRNTPHYEYGGESLTISEWSQKQGIPRSTILNRLKRGWDFKRAIEEPVHNSGVK